MQHIFVNQYLKETFGCKVYKLALDGGFTCPNRDGTKDTRGCIFCSAGGSGEFAYPPEEIKKAIDLVRKKVPKGGKYIAYFQAYTGTYGDVSRMESLYKKVLEREDIVAVSIATRPDCLGEDVLALLQELNQIKPVWIELGLQTIHENTAQYIRRGYDLSVYDRAVQNLKDIGIEQIITHVILGLPGESKEQMLATVDYVAKSGATGIKLQLLHILKGTDLEKEYLEGKIKVLEFEEYLDILSECLDIIPEEMIIHRITGDGDKKILVAPLWSGDKKRVLNAINRMMANK
ncbi:MAG: TIGR01212 family radical SAM protein [Lachnospiraceae bacterium]|nr:TIGR01212 family radical SAM protein [Lachnospiraceae bacterium]